MRHLFMGEHKRSRQAEGAAEAWEQRKTEQAARIAATMADPVLRFYQRHGQRAGRAEQASANSDPRTGGEEPGPA